MKKLILLYVCLFSYLFSNESFVTQLQTTFFNEVNEKNLYKKHYSHFLYETCQNNEMCINQTITRLKGWESVQNNPFLKHHQKEYYQQIELSVQTLHKIKEYLFTVIHSKKISTSQFLSFLDLSQQRLSVLFYDAHTQTLHHIGSDLVSTGNMEKEKEIKQGDDHYLKTPTGIFESLQGWRSSGEFIEEKNVMPYGQKERFVFYFGKQKSVRYRINGKKDTKPDTISDYLEFALHAHESTFKLGQPQSHGCIRISNELNLFLDEHLVLHANNIHNNQWKNPTAKAPKNFMLHPYFGKYLIIVDSI